MEILGMLSQASIVGLLSMVVGMLPIGFGLSYAIRPTEQRLALMRPISLAGIFAGLTGSLSGAINTLRYIWIAEPSADPEVVAVAAAEALVPMLVAFGALTVAWLCAAIGLKREPMNP
jgi:hypothetical protein